MKRPYYRLTYWPLSPFVPKPISSSYQSLQGVHNRITAVLEQDRSVQFVVVVEKYTSVPAQMLMYATAFNAEMFEALAETPLALDMHISIACQDVELVA